MPNLKSNVYSMLAGLALLALQPGFAAGLSHGLVTSETPEQAGKNTELYDPCALENPPTTDWMDMSHDYVSENVCNAAVWFDNFFGDERAEAEQVDRYIRVITEMRVQDDGEVDAKVRLRARIDLPNLKRNFNFILTDESERDVTRPPSLNDEPVSSNSGKSGYNMAVRWLPLLKPKSSFSASAGASLGPPLKPYLRLRYRYLHNLGPALLFRLTETGQWKNQEGFSETTRLDLEQLFSPQYMLRWTTGGTFGEETKGYEWSTGLSLYQNITRTQALSYNASVSGYTRPTSEISDYMLSVRYRRNFLRPWLFVEVEPAVNWPLDETTLQRDISFSFMLSLEMIFGRQRNAFDAF